MAETETEEPYDFVAKDRLTGEWQTFQCKTIRLRGDRKNEMVVYCKSGNGKPYPKSDVDLIIGVLAEDGEVPRVFYFENEEKGEVWASERTAAKRWVELPISLDRGMLAEDITALDGPEVSGITGAITEVYQ